MHSFEQTPASAFERHKLELATELLRAGGMIRIKARGTSMLPTIWPGDMVHIESKTGGELVVGDIVLVQQEKHVLIHRLMSTDGVQWITRGDAVPQNDPPIMPTDVLGRVTQIQRHNRAIKSTSRVMILQRALAWMLCHSQICRRFALRARSAWYGRAWLEIENISIDERSPQVP